MPAPREVEIKFELDDVNAVEGKLRALGFHEQTARTHEMNTLYDLPGGVLRARGELLRVREYGGIWTLTHKGPGSPGRHKSRTEQETEIGDGQQMDAILRALGFAPGFRYEKFRSEWTDGSGHVVLDQTPVGSYGEIEGAPEWIDRIASALQVSEDKYITASYAQLFFEWKQRTGSPAEAMTFEAVGSKR